MNKYQEEIFQTIGDIRSAIITSKNFDSAIKESLKKIIDNGISDYAIIYLKDKKDSNVILPYYWICPFDCSFKLNVNDNEIVSKCFSKEEMTFENNISDSIIKKHILDAKSSVCLKISLKDSERNCCIQLIKKEGNEAFNNDEIESLKILVYLLQREINENVPLYELDNKETIIVCEDVKKSYKSGDVVTQVLKGINFKVYKGEFLCLLGESGCGKSTLLNIVGGLISADSGSIKFEGKELVGLNAKQLGVYRRENIGFIFQQYNLMNNLNAIDNLKLIAELVKEPMDCLEALKLVKLAEKKDLYPSQLSGGQQQRVSIARALVKKPKLIFADEPTAALDYETSIEVLSVFEEVLKTGTTLIMVTHNEEIARMANRVIRFKNGKVFETSINLNPAKAKDLVW